MALLLSVIYNNKSSNKLFDQFTDYNDYLEAQESTYTGINTDCMVKV